VEALLLLNEDSQSHKNEDHGKAGPEPAAEARSQRDLKNGEGGKREEETSHE
jgi:hypothetical protein